MTKPKRKMVVEIPFNQRFIIEIAAGRKIYTSRTKKCGKVGDYFYVANKKIKCEIINIQKKSLVEIANKLFREEGFTSPLEFIGFWCCLHRKWTPKKEVYLHRFMRV